jgi:hypothetical protein
MEENEIVVESTEQFDTFRQSIRPTSQESVLPIIIALLEVYRANCLNGTATIFISAGGVRTLTYDQVVNVPDGSDADKVMEALFAKQSAKHKKKY